MSRWRKVITAHTPTFYGGPGLNGMSRDTVRNSAVLTCMVAQPWSYDLVGSFADWVSLGSPFGGLDQGRGRSSCWDVAHNKIVVFGGFVSGGGALNETWTYNTLGVWTRESPAHVPPAREEALMEYCPALGAVVMTGGSKSGGYNVPGDALSDTWMWDGTDWTQLFPAHQPTRVATHLCVLGSNVYFFGGMDLTVGRIATNDTWKFDGTDWTQLSPATSPPVAEWSKCASWPDRSLIVHAINPSSTLWLFDGTNWTSETPSCGPYNDGEPANHNDWDALGYLPRLGKVLGFLVNGETWELINNTGSTAVTNAATNNVCSTATLNGSVTVLAEETADVYFEYGPTTSYGTYVYVGTFGPGTTAISTVISGLTPALTYHYRVSLTCNGVCPVNVGSDVAFTQAACAGHPTVSTHFNLG